jgi:hypothetical protein
MSAEGENRKGELGKHNKKRMGNHGVRGKEGGSWECGVQNAEKKVMGSGGDWWKGKLREMTKLYQIAN